MFSCRRRRVTHSPCLCDEFEAYVDTGYRSEFDGYSLESIVNVPINDDICARFVAPHYEDNEYL